VAAPQVVVETPVLVVTHRAAALAWGAINPTQARAAAGVAGTDRAPLAPASTEVMVVVQARRAMAEAGAQVGHFHVNCSWPYRV